MPYRKCLNLANSQIFRSFQQINKNEAPNLNNFLIDSIFHAIIRNIKVLKCSHSSSLEANSSN